MTKAILWCSLGGLQVADVISISAVPTIIARVAEVLQESCRGSWQPSSGNRQPPALAAAAAAAAAAFAAKARDACCADLYDSSWKSLIARLDQMQAHVHLRQEQRTH